MLRTVQATAFMWLVIMGQALAQATTAPTTPAPGPTTAPAATHTADGGMNWLWLLIIAALIAAAVWYFMRRRGTARL